MAVQDDGVGRGQAFAATGLPLAGVQEGGYAIEDIPAAAAAFWAGPPPPRL